MPGYSRNNNRGKRGAPRRGAGRASNRGPNGNARLTRGNGTNRAGKTYSGRHRHDSANWAYENDGGWESTPHEHQILEDTYHGHHNQGYHSHGSDQNPNAPWTGTTTVNDHSHAVMTPGSSHNYGNNPDSVHEHEIQSLTNPVNQRHSHYTYGDTGGRHRHPPGRLPAPTQRGGVGGRRQGRI